MCKQHVAERDAICGTWKRPDYGVNLYPPDPQNNATIDTRPMFLDLNERVAEEMKKDIFVYFRHYSFERGPSLWRMLGTDTSESKKSHWWAKVKGLFLERRRKFSGRRKMFRSSPTPITHVFNNST